MALCIYKEGIWVCGREGGGFLYRERHLSLVPTSSYHGSNTPSYPGTNTLVPRHQYGSNMSSHPGTNTLVPRHQYPRTPVLIPSYPGSNTLVPRTAARPCLLGSPPFRPPGRPPACLPGQGGRALSRKSAPERSTELDGGQEGPEEGSWDAKFPSRKRWATEAGNRGWSGSVCEEFIHPLGPK